MHYVGTSGSAGRVMGPSSDWVVVDRQRGHIFQFSKYGTSCSMAWFPML